MKQLKYILLLLVLGLQASCKPYEIKIQRDKPAFGCISDTYYNKLLGRNYRYELMTRETGKPCYIEVHFGNGVLELSRVGNFEKIEGVKEWLKKGNKDEIYLGESWLGFNEYTNVFKIDKRDKEAKQGKITPHSFKIQDVMAMSYEPMEDIVFINLKTPLQDADGAGHTYRLVRVKECYGVSLWIK